MNFNTLITNLHEIGIIQIILNYVFSDDEYRLCDNCDKKNLNGHYCFDCDDFICINCDNYIFICDHCSRYICEDCGIIHYQNPRIMFCYFM